MKNYQFVLRLNYLIVCLVISLSVAQTVSGQQNVVINLAPIDGMPITPDNIFNYQVQSSDAAKVQIKGTIRYRSSNLSLSYAFSYTVKQGINVIRAADIHPQWQFSSSALQELFFTYKILPEGTFEYCVTVVPANAVRENGNLFEECLYHRSGDIFLINLIHPENKAKLREYNPMLSWVANYSFSNELTYRIRIAEMKQGQNPAGAVMRNQPMFDQNNLMENSIIYPLYAKPLEANKPYAWTVDAYYKGILLGGAEPWQFIIYDSLPPEVKVDRAYIDIARETGANHLTAIGTLRLKYVLEDQMNDSLFLSLVNAKDINQKYKLNPGALKAKYGDNRYELDLKNGSNAKHMTNYIMLIKTKTGYEYKLPFQYINPDYLH